MNIYQNNILKYKTESLKLAKVLKRLSKLRLASFIFSAILITVLANERVFTFLIIAVPLCILGMGLLINYYNQINHRLKHTSFLKEINEFEVLKMENKLSGFPTGQSFIGAEHPYDSDLDIFGSNSLFQLLNRTTTESGNLCLAEWLSEPSPGDEILKRQQAIKELTPKLEWLQNFQASGMHHWNAKSDYHKLLTWIEAPVKLLPQQFKYLIVSILLSALSTSTAVYYVIHAFTSDWYIHLLPLIIVLCINQLAIKRMRPVAEEIIINTQHNVKTLAGYRSLITNIESEEFESELLRQLQSTFCRHSYSARKEINKLKNILEISQLRGLKRIPIAKNQFYPILNLFLLVDFYWIIMTERWKQKNSYYLKTWVSAVSKFEVLSSIAGFSHTNPSYTFPEITEEPYCIHFELLGHPLIDSLNRKYNSFDLNGQGEIAMITGSNMAGKSTFLRTVGVNLVLALTGAPCCAKSGKVSQMKIFTSMRTQDNLEHGISSFYAELKRIEQLLRSIETGEPIFFLLDEMFKGTNSKDRHKGGFSLVKQLKEINAFGIISTHDLELAIIADSHKIVTNYSFNSEIQESQMVFNYKLTKGICKDFNASELMKGSGIKILPNIEELS